MQHIRNPLANGLNIGLAGAVMGAHGQLGTFLLAIAPHGLLELTCVAVGAGAGLRLFWAWLHPGPLPRTWALARAGRTVAGHPEPGRSCRPKPPLHRHRPSDSSHRVA